MRQNLDPGLDQAAARVIFFPCPGPTGQDSLSNQQAVLLFHNNSCQGEAPGPLEKPERKTMRDGWGVALCYRTLSNDIQDRG